MRIKLWIILSCFHWYKWDGETPTTDTMTCPNCGAVADILDKVPVQER